MTCSSRGLQRRIRVGQVDWTRMTVALPAFLTMVVQVGVVGAVRGVVCCLWLEGGAGPGRWTGHI